MYRTITSAMSLMLMALVFQSGADTLRVPEDFPTIQSAVNAAADGDTVLVGPGNYLEFIEFQHRRLSLISPEGSTRTNLIYNERDPHNAILVADSADVYIRGFRILGGMFPSLSVIWSSHCVAEDIVCEGEEVIVGYSLWVDSLSSSSFRNVVVRNSIDELRQAVIIDGLADFIDCSIINNAGTGITVEQRGEVTLTNCEIYGNAKYAVEVRNGSPEHVLNFQNNWWGEETTREMEEKGPDANITAIRDGRDVPIYSIVDYSNWERRTSVTGSRPPAPRPFTLFQNSPNPFNPSTLISFHLPQPSDVLLQIFDLAGRLVLEPITNQRLDAGRHEVRITGEAMSSGVYLYQIAAGGQRQTRKMVMMK